MNSPDADAREAMLTRVLAGELRHDAPEVQAAMAEDPELARELAEMSQLASELDDLGPSAMADAETEAEPWPGADQQMAELVRTKLANGAPGSSQASPRGAPILPILASLAAAALIVGVWLWNRTPTTPFAPPGTTLGAGEMWPKGETTRQLLAEHGFHWGANDVASSTFEVTVFDEAGETLAGPVVVRRTSRWHPADLVDTLPATFRWQLVAASPGRSKETWNAVVHVAP